MRPSEQPLIAADAIQARIAELATQINADYAHDELVCIAVLKGGLYFAADLTRQIRVPMKLDFVRARSYRGTLSTGTIEFTMLPETPLLDRHVLILEDILDTGRTTAALVDRLRAEAPASLKVCALLNKPAHREVQVPQDYVGFTIDDHFVIGYGLDYEERYRQLLAIHVLEEH
jgi:hypoxanthine phosphoribosyltransferase